MAYLKSTNIDGDLSVVNNIILEGGLNSTDGSDYYYGNTVKVIAGNTDLNTVTEPGVYKINYDVTPTLTNCPVSSEDTIKLIVHRLHISVPNFIQILLTTVGIYYRYAWVNESVFKPWMRFIGTDGTADTAQDNRAGLQLGTTLWSGSWSSGSITVPNINKYYLYFIHTANRDNGSNMGTVIIAARNDSWLRGMGGYTTEIPNLEHYYFNAQSTNNWQSINLIGCVHERNDGSATSYLTVKRIIGIV